MAVKRERFNWDQIPVSTSVGADPAIEVQPGVAAYEVAVPAGKRWQVEVAHMSMVASADAANRNMYLIISDATPTIMWISTLGLTITAGQTRTQTWARNSMITATGTQYGMHMPALELPAGWSVQVGIQNFDTVAAGDNASALTVYKKEAA